jgi:hypothetical protein
VRHNGPMKQPVVIVGLGEMGGVFARGFLRAGHPVYPVTRGDDMAEVAAVSPDPALVLITVGEDDLEPVLAALPDTWRTRVGLIQNELLPRDWTPHGIDDPTVASVWFEKKPGTAVTVIIPTPVAGPAAELVVAALEAIDIPSVQIDPSNLVDVLVAKNLYILTVNIAGLPAGGTVWDVWEGNRDLARAVAGEILDIQEYLVGAPIDRDRAVAAMTTAIVADPDHGATGRSAPRRLERARRNAAAAGLQTPALDEIAEAIGL